MPFFRWHASVDGKCTYIRTKTIIHLQLCIKCKKTLQTVIGIALGNKIPQGFLFGYKIHETMGFEPVQAY
jgi:hypothetical protein